MRRLAALLIVAALAGCNSSPSASSTAPTQAATASSGDETAPADLGLKQVKTDAAAARSATIGADGGTIAVTAADGTTFALDLPAGAVADDTAISVYPVNGLGTLPSSSHLAAGVQFAPEGLRLRRPATLTVTLASGHPATLGAVSWDGDGANLHAPPVLLGNGSATFMVLHFSGLGLTLEQEAVLTDCGETDFACETDVWVDGFYKDYALHDRAGMIGALQLLDDVADHAFNHSLRHLLDGQVDLAEEARDAYPYDMLWSILTLMQAHDPTFAIPGFDRSKAKPIEFLQDWYDAENQRCRDRATDPRVASPLLWAEAAIDGALAHAALWEVDTGANRLDVDALLDNLCVKVVLDPAPSYSAANPGDSGDVKVTAGFSIDGGPVRSNPDPIRVVIRQGRAGPAVADHDTDSNGEVTATGVTWPASDNPVVFSIVATLTDSIGGNEVLTNIRASRGLTKGTTSEIAFTSVIPGHSQIEVMDSDGSGSATEVTLGPLDLAPTWAPDGSTIAFARSRSGIWTVKPDGSGAKQLLADTSATDPVWSPDGTQIAFLRAIPGTTNGRYNIALMNADGSNVRDTGVLVAVPGIAWSPDSKRVAYVANDTDAITIRISGKDVFFHPYRIYLYDIAGGGSTKLVTHDCEPYGAIFPAWSPDGTRIAINCIINGNHHTQVGTIGVGGGAFSPLWTAPDDLPYQATWSPDGAQLAIGARNLGILVFNVGGGGSTGPTTIGAGTDALVEALDWSP